MINTPGWLTSLGLFSARALVVFVLVGLFALSGVAYYEGTLTDVSDGSCNIAVIPLRGSIDAIGYQYPDGTVYTVGDDVIRQVKAAENDPFISGILVTVDSYGGHAGPSFDMMEAFRDSSLPVLAYIREVGTSGAYMAASGADYIIASPYAEVGSIGVTYSYTEFSKKNADDGVTFVQVSSGEFKDLGNPNKPLTQGERAVLEQNLSDFKEQFVWDVAVNRGMTTTTVEAIADGSAISSGKALSLGLVDQMGGMNEVKQWFASEFELDPLDIVPCI